MASQPAKEPQFHAAMQLIVQQPSFPFARQSRSLPLDTRVLSASICALRPASKSSSAFLLPVPVRAVVAVRSLK